MTNKYKKPEDEEAQMIRAIVFLVATILLFITTLVVLNSCTLNVIMTHTEGEASDVVDSNPSNEPRISPTISTPIIP